MVSTVRHSYSTVSEAFHPPSNPKLGLHIYWARIGPLCWHWRLVHRTVSSGRRDTSSLHYSTMLIAFGKLYATQSCGLHWISVSIVNELPDIWVSVNHVSCFFVTIHLNEVLPLKALLKLSPLSLPCEVLSFWFICIITTITTTSTTSTKYSFSVSHASVSLDSNLHHSRRHYVKLISFLRRPIYVKPLP